MSTKGDKNSNGSKKSPAWMTGEYFRSLDSFGQSLPKFIIKGRDKAQSRLGGVITIIIYIYVLMYATFKFL